MVSRSDAFEESLLWSVKHDMKVLQSMYRFQTRPILEPYQLLSSMAFCPTEFRDDELPDLVSGPWRQVICNRIIFESELCPDDEMNYVGLDAIWPVVVEDLPISMVSKMCFSRRDGRIPLKTLVQYKTQN